METNAQFMLTVPIILKPRKRSSLKDGIASQIGEKGTRPAALIEEQKEANKKKSKVRARVEHVFGAHDRIAACPS